MTATSSTTRARRLFRRVGGIVAALVGLVMLVVGGVTTVSRTWPLVTATVQSCTVVMDRATNHSSTAHQHCVVTWPGGSGTVDFAGRASHSVGESVRLRVHGQTAVEDSPPWVGYGVLALGALLVAAGLYVAIRRPRR